MYVFQQQLGFSIFFFFEPLLVVFRCWEKTHSVCSKFSSKVVKLLASKFTSRASKFTPAQKTSTAKLPVFLLKILKVNAVANSK